MNHRRIRNVFTALAGLAVLCAAAAGVASALPYFHPLP